MEIIVSIFRVYAIKACSCHFYSCLKSSSLYFASYDELFEVFMNNSKSISMPLFELPCWDYHLWNILAIATDAVLLWLLTAACIKTGRPQIARRAIELAETRLVKDNWPEYYDGKLGRFVGKQARKLQTWSIAGYLVAKMLLEDPSHLGMVALEEDKQMKPPMRRSHSWTFWCNLSSISTYPCLFSDGNLIFGGDRARSSLLTHSSTTHFDHVFCLTICSMPNTFFHSCRSSSMQILMNLNPSMFSYHILFRCFNV